MALKAIHAHLIAPSRTAMAMATPDSWAPEQALGKAVTPATCLYTVAAMLFELSAGRPPYVPEDPARPAPP